MLLPALIAGGFAANAAASPGARALDRLSRDSAGPVRIYESPGTGRPVFIAARIPFARFTARRSASGRGRDFWAAYGAAFGVRDPAELEPAGRETDELGQTHLRYDQRHAGLPVYRRRLLLHLDATGVRVVNGDFVPRIDVDPRPSVTAAAAALTARAALRKRAPRPSPSPPELLVFVDGADDPHLTWQVTLPTGAALGLWRVFVDAHSGRVLRLQDDLVTAQNRETYDGGSDPDCNTLDAPLCTLPGALARAEASPASADPVVNDAHVNAGRVYDYFHDTFGRDSYDGAGHSIRSTVHFGVGYNNAFWCDDACAAAFGGAADGEQMAYGDGDGSLFSPLGADIDVVAHELTHAVTSSEAGLDYFGQPGALNESYSDVFATMLDTDDWLIGERSFTPFQAGDALRSLRDPPDYGQPDHMANYLYTVFDNAGVHTNSGIPNRAAYLVTAAPVYGVGRAAAQQIFYRALTTYLTPTSDFAANLNALRQSALDLFPASAAHVRAVERAYAAVGIVDRPTVAAPNGGESLDAGASTAVQWTPGGDTGLSTAVSFLRESTPSDYDQGFEAVSFPAELSTSGDGPWFPDAFASRSGTRSAGSGEIGNGGRSELRLTRTLAEPGTVTFHARVSSEENFDFFSFHVDGELVALGSGEIAWTPVSVPLSAGTHRLVWVYEKDVSFFDGADAAWIDDLVVPDVENVVRTTINPAAAPGVTSQPWLPPPDPGTNYKIRVSAGGAVSWLASDDSDDPFAVVLPPQLAIGSANVLEGAPGSTATATFPVTLTEAPAPGEQVTVDYQTTADGSARATDDFLPVAGGTLVFEAGETAKEVTVSVVGDALDEANETFSVHLADAEGATIGAHHGKGTILDDDPAPALRIGDVRVREGASGTRKAVFVVRLSRASGRTASVRFTTANGTARAPGDYRARVGLLTFLPGQTARSVAVAVMGDRRRERDETFFVKLGSALHASLADARGRGVIRDDD